MQWKAPPKAPGPGSSHSHPSTAAVTSVAAAAHSPGEMASEALAPGQAADMAGLQRLVDAHEQLLEYKAVQVLDLERPPRSPA